MGLENYGHNEKSKAMESMFLVDFALSTEKDKVALRELENRMANESLEDVFASKEEMLPMPKDKTTKHIYAFWKEKNAGRKITNMVGRMSSLRQAKEGSKGLKYDVHPDYKQYVGQSLYQLVTHFAAEHNVPASLAFSLAADESGMRNILSSNGAGAKGVWQFTKGTGRLYGLRVNGKDYRNDLAASTEAAMRHLADNLKVVNNTLRKIKPKPKLNDSQKWMWAMWGYNASITKVMKVMRNPKCKGDPEKYIQTCRFMAQPKKERRKLTKEDISTTSITNLDKKQYDGILGTFDVKQSTRYAWKIAGYQHLFMEYFAGQVVSPKIQEKPKTNPEKPKEEPIIEEQTEVAQDSFFTKISSRWDEIMQDSIPPLTDYKKFNGEYEPVGRAIGVDVNHKPKEKSQADWWTEVFRKIRSTLGIETHEQLRVIDAIGQKYDDEANAPYPELQYKRKNSKKYYDLAQKVLQNEKISVKNKHLEAYEPAASALGVHLYMQDGETWTSDLEGHASHIIDFDTEGLTLYSVASLLMSYAKHKDEIQMNKLEDVKDLITALNPNISLNPMPEGTILRLPVTQMEHNDKNLAPLALEFTPKNKQNLKRYENAKKVGKIPKEYNFAEFALWRIKKLNPNGVNKRIYVPYL